MLVEPRDQRRLCPIPGDPELEDLLMESPDEVVLGRFQDDFRLHLARRHYIDSAKLARRASTRVIMGRQPRVLRAQFPRVFHQYRTVEFHEEGPLSDAKARDHEIQ